MSVSIRLDCFDCVFEQGDSINLFLILLPFEDNANGFAREGYFVRWFHAPFVVEQMRVGATILVAQVVNVGWNKVVAAVAKNDSLIPLDCLFDSAPMIGWSYNGDVFCVTDHAWSIPEPMRAATFLFKKITHLCVIGD